MPLTQTATQPGARRRGLRRVVVVLSTVQIVSWGCLCYAFAAVQSSVIAKTGWSGVAVTGAFPLAQVVSAVAGLWVGRHIDAHGSRAVLTFGSVLAVRGLLGADLAPMLPWFYAGWVLVGAAMAGTLYPPAFAALTRWVGSRIGARTTLTLVAGLASTVLAPLAPVLHDLVGWRLAYILLLGGLGRHHGTAALVGLERALGTKLGYASRVGRVDGAECRRSDPQPSVPVPDDRQHPDCSGDLAVIVNLVSMLVEQGRAATARP